jgi:hypothetical protein
MLDPFLQKKVTGQAGIDYEIVQTRPDMVVEVLDEKYEYNDVAKILQSHAFHTLFLSMSVKMHDPDTWVLSWARFEFEIDGYNASVLSFAPNVDGVKTIIEKNGSREFNMGLSAELGLPVSPAPVDVKISSDITYNKKNGWTVKFDATVEEVKGFKTRTANGAINLQWDIYKNNAIQVPQSNIGTTSGVYATALIGSPKGSDTIVNVKVSGETVRKGTSIRGRGVIELNSVCKFMLEPTL